MPQLHFGPESEPLEAALTLLDYRLCLGRPLGLYGTRIDKPHRVGAPAVERANGYQDGYQG
jgi:hypothetical protein